MDNNNCTQRKPQDVVVDRATALPQTRWPSRA